MRIKNKKLKSKLQKKRKGTRSSMVTLEPNAYKEGSLAHAVSTYLKVKKFEFAESTYQGVKTHARHIIRYAGEMPVSEMTTSTIDDFKLAMLDSGAKGKVINGCFTIFRHICRKAATDRVHSNYLMEGVKNVTVSDTTPNPFSEDEIDKLLSLENDAPMSKLMLMFGLATGLRISELIVVDWLKVRFHTEDDVEKARIYIDRAKPLNNYKITKTADSDRCIELSHEATLILRQMEQYTMHMPAIGIDVVMRDNITVKKEKFKPVFYNDQTRQPWLNPKQFAKQFFTPFLKAAGVEHRGPNQLRHTCASLHFNQGIALAWIASLLGHKSVSIVEKHYAKRIHVSLKKEQEKANQTIDRMFKSPQENSIVVPQDVIAVKQQTASIKSPSNNKDILDILQLILSEKDEHFRKKLCALMTRLLDDEE